MHVILLALGLVISLAGIVLIGFGVRRDGLGAGDTLLMVGTIALVGSLGLIGLASAIRQLRRIAQLLEPRPVPRALGPEPVVGAAASAAPAVAVPAPVLPREPRFETGERPAAAAPEVPSVRPEDRQPAAVAIPVAAAVVEEPPAQPSPPTAPLPRRAFEGFWRRARAPDAAPEVPSVTPEDRQPAAVAIPVAAAVVEEPPAQPSPPTAPQPRRAFEGFWRRAPAPDAYSAVATAVIETPRADRDHVEPAAATPQAQIFKSGVIDGMAYTLYTDGSIEAEVAEGTVKFASIDELRAYLASRES